MSVHQLNVTSAERNDTIKLSNKLIFLQLLYILKCENALYRLKTLANEKDINKMAYNGNYIILWVNIEISKILVNIHIFQKFLN